MAGAITTSVYKSASSILNINEIWPTKLSNMQDFNDCPIIVWRITGLSKDQAVAGSIKISGNLQFATPANQEFQYRVKQLDLKDIQQDTNAINTSAYILDSSTKVNDMWVQAMFNQGESVSKWWYKLFQAGKKLAFALSGKGILKAIIDTIEFIITPESQIDFNNLQSQENFDNDEVDDVKIQVATITPLDANPIYQNITFNTGGQDWIKINDETSVTTVSDHMYVFVTENGHIYFIKSTGTSITPPEKPAYYVDFDDGYMEGAQFYSEQGQLIISQGYERAFIESGIPSDFFR